MNVYTHMYAHSRACTTSHIRKFLKLTPKSCCELADMVAFSNAVAERLKSTAFHLERLKSTSVHFDAAYFQPPN